MLNLSELYQLYIFKTVVGGLILLVTWLIARALDKSLHLIEQRQGMAPEVAILVNNVVKNLVYIIGLITVLKHFGIAVDAILASLGIGGLAVGFAFKDSLSNLISGIVLIAYRPFSIGDTVTLRTDKLSITGRVLGINFRYITLEDDQVRTIIPNSLIVSSPVMVNKQ